MYLLFFSSPSKGGRKGGVTLGRLAKLFGNLAVLVLAMAEALRMAKGFLPVRELFCPLPPDTRLLVPLVLVVLEMPRLGPPEATWVPEVDLSEATLLPMVFSLLRSVPDY